jgi:hypothetical protein
LTQLKSHVRTHVGKQDKDRGEIRWKIEYKGTVFITDSTMKVMVTAYAAKGKVKRVDDYWEDSYYWDTMVDKNN